MNFLSGFALRKKTRVTEDPFELLDQLYADDKGFNSVSHQGIATTDLAEWLQCRLEVPQEFDKLVEVSEAWATRNGLCEVSRM